MRYEIKSSQSIWTSNYLGSKTTKHFVKASQIYVCLHGLRASILHASVDDGASIFLGGVTLDIEG